MGVLLASLAALVYGVADYCGGRSSRSVNSTAVTFWAEAAGLLVVVVMLPFVAGRPLPRGDVGWGVATAAAASVGLVCFYRALSSGAMTIVAPLTAVVSAVIPVGVGLVQGERPGSATLIGCGLAAAAIALVSGAGGPTKVRPSMAVLALALVAGLGFAFVFISLDATSGTSGVWPVVVARLASLPMVAGAAGLMRESLRVPRGIWPIVALGGVCDMTANVLYLSSTNHGMLAVVAVLTALYPVTTVVLAYLLDGERMTRLQSLGLALAISSLALVGVGEHGTEEESADPERDEIGHPLHAELGEVDAVGREQVGVLLDHVAPIEHSAARQR